MTQRVQVLDVDFSTADAQYPSFAMGDTGFSLAFRDWQEQRVCVAFENVAGLRWEALDSGNDQVYEVADSEWVTTLLRTTDYSESDGLRHFRLCFNPHGVLDVLASSMRRVAG